MIKGSFSYRARKELGFSREIWQRGFPDVRITDREPGGLSKSRTRYSLIRPKSEGMAQRITALPRSGLLARHNFSVACHSPRILDYEIAEIVVI